MAQCKQSAQEFIQDVFSPMVAVLCSHDAELVCQRNNLTFVELVQPFCRLNSESTIRDSGNMTHTIRNLKITMRDMNQHPPQPTLAKKMMNEAVCNALPASTDLSRSNIMTVGDYDLQISGWTSWYEAYRETFNIVAYPSDHEFIRHYLACLFVVSSSHADPLEQLRRLTTQQHEQQHQQPHKPYPKWFCPNILRYYVLLHDVASETAIKAEGIYQSMKNTYGVNNCHLLQINSRQLGGEAGKESDPGGLIPDPWSQFITKRQNEFTDGEFDTWSSATEGELSFPSQLSEGANSLPSANPATLTSPASTASMVDSAIEVMEDSPTSDASPGDVIDHPLAIDSTDTSPTQNNLPTPTQPTAPTTPSANSTDKTIINPTHKRSKSGGHGICLSLSDHDRLRIFVQEFVVRGVIPWAERMLRTLNEQVVTRKGLHRSLFSATKKWFGGGGGGGGGGGHGHKHSPSPAVAAAAGNEKTNVIYTPEAPEMQQRRLADLAFMFQMYESAYQTYHACKRDFNSDHAWLHFAGSLEMAGLSVYMQGSTSQRQYPHHYMESAITTYLNTCRNPVFATRATLLSTEALKSKSMYEEAAMQFIKMTSEDSDLRSALLLEQASHCFIRMKQPMVRKYAFHMILAGHRFSKAGQRRHALRAYQQALQVYKGKLWSLAEDHINFTIGRQSFNLKHLENAAAAFKHLLTSESKQSPPQQHAFLREYLFVYKQLSSNLTSELPQLPLPIYDSNAIKVLTAKPPPPQTDPAVTMATSVTFDSSEADNATWQKLEELLVVSVYGSIPQNHKQTIQCSTQRTVNTANPIAFISEAIMVQVHLTNPLRIPLLLSDICLLWRFVAAPDPNHPERPPPVSTNETVLREAVEEENDDTMMGTSVDVGGRAVFTESLSQVLLEASQTQKLELIVIPQQQGELHITGLAYNVASNASQAASSTASSALPSAPTAVIMDTSKQCTPDMATTAAQSPSDNNSASKTNNVMCVRGKVNLEVQGPRLNGNKEEKSAKMYGPDRRLDLLVMPQMPLLEVSFHHFPKTLLCGEVRQLSVQFTNSGSLPLTNLRVASTHPNFFTCGAKPTSAIPSHSSSSSPVYKLHTNEKSSQGFTLVEESIVKHVTSLSVGGPLQPGQSVSLPMWVCGPSETGEHTIRFLFYYETTAANVKLRHRVLRHEATVTVLPSLLLKAVASRSMACTDNCKSSSSSSSPNPDDAEGEGGKLTVSLQIYNRNTVSESSVKEFQILQVSCASQEWKLRHLSANSREGDVPRVGGGEGTMMCLRATRFHMRKRKTSRGQLETAGKNQHHVFTNVSFSDSEVDSGATPCSDFFVRSRLSLGGGAGTFEKVEVEAPKPAQVIERKADPAEDRLRPLKHALESKLTLIVLWKAVVTSASGEQEEITGQHHIGLDTINNPVIKPHIPKVSLEPKTLQIIPPVREEQGDVISASPIITSQLLNYTLHYPHSVSHDFSKHRLCQTHVVLLLQNCSNSALIVDLKTMQLSQSSSTSSSSSAAAAAAASNSSGSVASNAASSSSSNTNNAATSAATADTNPPAPSAASSSSSGGLEGRFGGGCLWSGQNMTQISLHPAHTHKLQLQVCFLKAGVYNLSSSLQVHAAPPNAASVLQRPPPPSLIIISNNTTQC